MRKFKPLLYLSLLLFGWQSCLAADKHEEIKINPHHIPAATCGACHKEIYEQWKTSLHSQSSPLSDPVHAGIYRETVGDPNQEGVTLNGEYPVCLQCHAPNAAKDNKTNLTEYNYAEGVNCVICHTLRTYKGEAAKKGPETAGLNAFERSENYLQAPSGRYLSPTEDAVHPFPMEPNQTLLRTSRVCLGCHTQYKEVAMCQVGIEVTDKTVTCQSCHMPKINGLANHSVLSAHSEAMLSRSLVVTLLPNIKGDMIDLSVRLENMLPHHFPAGVPYRNAFVKVTAYSRDDELLWSNFQSYPPTEKDDPKAVLRYIIDNDSNPVMLPFNNNQVSEDKRLKPYEIRELKYQLSRNKVFMLRAEVLYNRLTLPLIDKFADELEGDVTNPTIVAIAELRI